MSRQFHSITVAELRELLEGQPDDTIVTFASDYGDRPSTMQVHRLRGDAEMKPIEESAYSDSGWALRSEKDDEDEDEEDAEEGQMNVLVIS